MGRPDFGRPATPPIPHHLHYDGDVVDGDAVKGLQHGLPAEPIDPLGFRWRVPLSWVHNPFGVLALFQDQLNAQTHDQVIVY